ncbi:MAG: RluA family pseudouridine synthase [Elusimicrobiota bacterium]|jgi:23S rRNA pseudouridine1911/1915/1917 synthase|nr:RluA family pseudouridine synthase [Elusimicrobiota bacterium]
MQKIKYEKFERERIDSFLASIYKEYSRSYFQKLIESSLGNKGVRVNEKNISSSYKLKRGDFIEIEFPAQLENLGVKAEKIDIDIIYEDDDIIVINKPFGIVVHPSYGHLDGTLLNALVGYADEKFIPYLVHRLDKDTSGLILFAKNEKSKISISKQFQNRAVKKIYYAAVKGTIVENRGRIEAPLGRAPENRKIMSVNPLATKMAISEFSVMARRDGFTLVKVHIITGRTHQIRSHMKYINHPVVGDKQYGGPQVINSKIYSRQMLHSYQISFTHPKTSKNLTFIAPLAEDMKEIFEI